MKLRPLKVLKVSAASGLLVIEDQFYSIADDELDLIIFNKESFGSERRVQLLDGALPLYSKQRKAQKPDWESLVLFPESQSILVVPSGSKANRNVGVWIESEKITQILFTELYQVISQSVPDLNVEGVVLTEKEMRLFSRGNGGSQQNFMIRLDREKVLSDILACQSLTAKSFVGLMKIDLGMIHGFPLGFTDASLEDENRIWFLAAAEAAASTYEDGKYLGAILGCLDNAGNLIFQDEIECQLKPEGLALDIKNRKFYVVTDADDRSQPAQLLEGDLPFIE